MEKAKIQRLNELAKLSKERAEQMLTGAKSDSDVSIASAKLMRALNRINVAGMK